MQRLLIVAVGGLMVLSACSAGDGANEAELPLDDDLPVASGQTQSSDEPIPVEPNGGIGDGSAGDDLPVVSPKLSSEIDTALLDLQQRLGDDRLIEIVVAFELTWPNSALGCPVPDMAYAEMLVDGYLIELSDGETTYVYHGASGEEPFLCIDGEGPAAAPGDGSPVQQP